MLSRFVALSVSLIKVSLLQRSRINIRICVDALDTIFFQDDRLWVQYGGNYGAAGATWCPGDDWVE